MSQLHVLELEIKRSVLAKTGMCIHSGPGFRAVRTDDLVFWGAVSVPVPIWIPLTPANRELACYGPDSKPISLHVSNEAHGNRQGGASLSEPVMSPFWINEEEHEDSNMPDFNIMKSMF